MSNLGELCGSARLPVFERLSKGFPAVAGRVTQSIHDLTTAELKAELKRLQNKYDKASPAGKTELRAIAKGLLEILTDRAEGMLQ